MSGALAPVIRRRPKHTNEYAANHEKMNKCECGCGSYTNQTFIHNHHRRGRKAHPGEYDTRSRANSSMWKGGRAKHSAGYIMITRPDHHYHNHMGYVFEHRLVWEEFHKASLLPWTDIHHKNKDVTDNRIENLEAMFHGKHMSHHNHNKHIPRWDLSDRFIIDWRYLWRWLFNDKRKLGGGYTVN